MFENKNEPLQKRNKKIYFKDLKLNPKDDPESNLALGDFMILIPNGSEEETAKTFLNFVKNLKVESLLESTR
ncbi:hypothetical protein K2P97_10135 [bacterium]|nr:hypothetical protein [bacterium]